MRLSAIAALILFSAPVVNQAASATEKELYLPDKVDRVPDKNDYDNDDSEYSFKRMVQGDNVAIFWHKEYGDDPMANEDKRRRFDVNYMLKECERFYSYYVDELKLVQNGKSVSDNTKLLIYVFGGEGGTAYGGGIENKVGALWTPAVRVNRAPYGVLAHEMGHSFQFMARIDNGRRGIRGAINEMSAQYVLWQVYPEWMTFENYHLVDFMKKTHYAFLHATNMYHSPYVLEYWSNKHGKEFFANLCRDTQAGEDPVMTYQRMNALSQAQFNDEMFDACRRFITWDMDRIQTVAKRYANQHHSVLNDVGDGWYRIAVSHCPQNYGYNGIKLKVPAAGTNVVLNFRGMAGAEGYSTVKTDKAGWRYGFLASLKDGSRVYGNVGTNPQDAAAFQVPEETEHLWLVVMGAPTEHWPIVMGRRRGGPEDNTEEQWPYQIKLTGTTLEDSFVEAI
ncbi:MAG: DUF6055 domain-containing protein [Phycisphaerae bacterium]|nr:DUF6055 domain-containing protein [Phycisphaerae bacterium]